jgi:hypothetical protein
MFYRSYKDRAQIYVMYIREAHPVGGPRPPPARFQIPDPKTLEERRRVAREFADEVKISVPILVDGIDDRVERAYAGWPDRIYIIDGGGKIIFKGEPGPGGFRPSLGQAPSVLDQVLGSVSH